MKTDEPQLEFRANHDISPADYNLIKGAIKGVSILAIRGDYDEVEEIFRLAFDDAFDVTEEGVEDNVCQLGLIALASVGYATILRFAEHVKKKQEDEQ